MSRNSVQEKQCSNLSNFIYFSEFKTFGSKNSILPCLINIGFLNLTGQSAGGKCGKWNQTLLKNIHLTNFHGKWVMLLAIAGTLITKNSPC